MRLRGPARCTRSRVPRQRGAGRRQREREDDCAGAHRRVAVAHQGLGPGVGRARIASPGSARPCRVGLCSRQPGHARRRADDRRASAARRRSTWDGPEEVLEGIEVLLDRLRLSARVDFGRRTARAQDVLLGAGAHDCGRARAARALAAVTTPDTSVLVAGADPQHPFFDAAAAALATVRSPGVLVAHTIAETHAVLTGSANGLAPARVKE